MPNHVTNRITIHADGAQLNEILEAVKYDEVGIGSIDFNKLIPMPESLNIESGSETDRAISLYLTAINPMQPDMGCGKVSMEELAALNQGLNRKNCLRSYSSNLTQGDIAKYTQYKPLDEYLSLGKAAVENFINYGSATWYEWSIRNWGTKWNAYGYDDTDFHPKENVLEFKTAWDSVPEIMQVLSEKYPDVEFTYEYADEDIGSNAGRLVYFGGEITYEDIPRLHSKEAYEMAFDIWKCSPEDYDLVFSEDTGTYEFKPDLEMSME